jgi:hypothetical protein
MTSGRFRAHYLHKTRERTKGSTTSAGHLGRWPAGVVLVRSADTPWVGASWLVLRSTIARPHKPLTRLKEGCLACRQKTPTSKE